MSTNKSTGHGHTATASEPLSVRKLAIIIGLVVGAFLLSYNYAAAKSGGQGSPAAGLAAGGGCGMSGAAGAGAAGAGGASGGGGCCGGGGPAVEAATSVEGNVQKIAVDTSAGSFNPNVIKAKAGVPIEIAFSQAPGGCLSGVFFPDFNINEDLTAGGKTVQLPALEKGEYQFFCQMQMVSAKIVVE